MVTLPRRLRWMSTLLAAFMLVALIPQPALAAMIGTQALVQETEAQDARARLQTLLQRDDVRERLTSLGVTPEAAEKRVAALSDQEVRHLVTDMDTMPAGGISVLGAALVVFLVLLATDILGYTDIFPFVTGQAEFD